MTTDQAARPASRHVPGHRRPPALHAERAGLRLATRQIWFGALVVAVSTGLLLWLGVVAYHKSQTSGGGLMTAMAGLPAMRAVYGLPTAIGTLGGFAVWRVELFVTLLGTIWITLATTRVLRGDEETGRLDLVLASPITLPRITAVSLTAIAAAPLLTALVTGSVLQGLGAAAPGSWLYAAAIGLLLATFAAVAAVASQAMPERRRAAGLAMGVLFGTFVIRMWADGSRSAGWARWLTPFGWVQQVHAFGGDDLLPLVPLLAAPAAGLTAALLMARRRDAGAGMVRAADTRQASTALLSRPLAIATRRRIGELAAWGPGLAILGILSGGLSQSYVGFPQSQPQATQLLRHLGLGAVITPGGFIATMDTLYAVLLAGYALACIHGDYDDEVAGRLDLPYSNLVTRTSWAGATVATTVAAMMTLTVILGLGTWAGSALSGAGLTAGGSLAAAANVLPVALIFLGLGVLRHGVRPAWATGVTGMLAIVLYLINLLGPGLSWPGWLLALSPYHHLALVPAEPAAWKAMGVMLGTATATTAAGLLCYARRDLR